MPGSHSAPTVKITPEVFFTDEDNDTPDTVKNPVLPRAGAAKKTAAVGRKVVGKANAGSSKEAVKRGTVPPLGKGSVLRSELSNLQLQKALGEGAAVKDGVFVVGTPGSLLQL